MYAGSSMIRLMWLCLILAGCAAAPQKPTEPKIISVIGLGACDKWLGGIAVTSDGQLHGSNDMTAEQATELAKPLGKGASMLAMAPCVKEEGIGT